MIILIDLIPIPGYHVPVYSPKKLINNKPDIIVILAWRFKDEIIKKLDNNFMVMWSFLYYASV